MPGTSEPITTGTIQTTIDRRGDWNPTAGSATLRPKETGATSEIELAYKTSGPTSLTDIEVTLGQEKFWGDGRPAMQKTARDKSNTNDILDAPRHGKSTCAESDAPPRSPSVRRVRKVACTGTLFCATNGDSVNAAGGQQDRRKVEESELAGQRGRPRQLGQAAAINVPSMVLEDSNSSLQVDPKSCLRTSQTRDSARFQTKSSTTSISSPASMGFGFDPNQSYVIFITSMAQQSCSGAQSKKSYIILRGQTPREDFGAVSGADEEESRSTSNSKQGRKDGRGQTRLTSVEVMNLEGLLRQMYVHESKLTAPL
ncbi:hypothetical protein T265_05384 [Opisthorchis viverrini]|uniref:Uncharacterized protein n=1 Tax=Opisthorchis viverrini TaxID=6198 RepID=A0A074ZKK0_OPIVI|nr:hypothetical protein T265_05384 [Opisthorchis viverrini]KER27566.1 hypothetical protein T265_05384 [Opisthorchis viverrini]